MLAWRVRAGGWNTLFGTHRDLGLAALIILPGAGGWVGGWVGVGCWCGLRGWTGALLLAAGGVSLQQELAAPRAARSSPPKCPCSPQTNVALSRSSSHRNGGGLLSASATVHTIPPLVHCSSLLSCGAPRSCRRAAACGTSGTGGWAARRCCWLLPTSTSESRPGCAAVVMDTAGVGTMRGGCAARQGEHAWCHRNLFHAQVCPPPSSPSPPFLSHRSGFIDVLGSGVGAWAGYTAVFALIVATSIGKERCASQRVCRESFARMQLATNCTPYTNASRTTVRSRHTLCAPSPSTAAGRMRISHPAAACPTAASLPLMAQQAQQAPARRWKCLCLRWRTASLLHCHDLEQQHGRCHAHPLAPLLAHFPCTAFFLDACLGCDSRIDAMNLRCLRQNDGTGLSSPLLPPGARFGVGKRRGSPLLSLRRRRCRQHSSQLRERALQLSCKFSGRQGALRSGVGARRWRRRRLERTRRGGAHLLAHPSAAAAAQLQLLRRLQPPLCMLERRPQQLTQALRVLRQLSTPLWRCQRLKVSLWAAQPQGGLQRQPGGSHLCAYLRAWQAGAGHLISLIVSLHITNAAAWAATAPHDKGSPYSAHTAHSGSHTELRR